MTLLVNNYIIKHIIVMVSVLYSTVFNQLVVCLVPEKRIILHTADCDNNDLYSGPLLH